MAEQDEKSDRNTTGDEPESEEVRKPKRRKRKKAKSSTKHERDDLRPELDARGRERPRFLLGFPKHPELEPLIQAFETGNYALVRRDAPALAERTDDPAVRDAAIELRRRIDPDPLYKYLLGVSVVLLAFLTAYAYLGHSH
jgi:hypothetical protein